LHEQPGEEEIATTQNGKQQQTRHWQNSRVHNSPLALKRWAEPGELALVGGYRAGKLLAIRQMGGGWQVMGEDAARTFLFKVCASSLSSSVTHASDFWWPIYGIAFGLTSPALYDWRRAAGEASSSLRT
jgi:hypothetical protein